MTCALVKLLFALTLALLAAGCGGGAAYRSAGENLDGVGGVSVQAFEADGVSYLVDPTPDGVRLSVTNVGDSPVEPAGGAIVRPGGGRETVDLRTLPPGGRLSLRIPPISTRRRVDLGPPDIGPIDQGGLIYGGSGGAPSAPRDAAAFAWPAGSTVRAEFAWQRGGATLRHAVVITKVAAEPPAR